MTSDWASNNRCLGADCCGTERAVSVVVNLRCSLLFLATLAFAGCADLEGEDFDSDDKSDTLPSQRVETVPCRYPMPELGLIAGQDYECGDFIVPENRAVPIANIRLHFLRFKSQSSSKNATVYLAGGPGGNGEGLLPHIKTHGQSFLDGLLVDGDFVILSQRGSAMSVPSLACEPALCAELAIVAHLPSYNTAYSADDIDEFRQNLGYDKLNLFGISYGSRLGLETMRRHGDKIRSAALAGLIPSQTNWTARAPTNFRDALAALDASCASHASCASAYGNLEEKLLQGMDSLARAPLTVPLSNEEFLELDGSDYGLLIFNLLHTKGYFRHLPQMISDFAVRRTDRVSSVIEAFQNRTPRSFSAGLYYSTLCGELFNPPDLNAFTRNNEGVALEFKELFASGWNDFISGCSNFPKGSLQAELAVAVDSAVPSLIASGTLDPITPPSYGEIAAAGLSESQVVVFENSGHGSLMETDCGRQLLLKFLADPTKKLDASCAASVGTDYVLP